jgi:GNAT superfamily N-acetyltransferase
MKNIVLRIFDLIKKGELKFMIKGIVKRIYSTHQSFGLKRDIEVEVKQVDALINIDIRLFKAEDNAHFTADLQNDGLIEKDIPNCYVATNTEDVPCYRHWLMGPKQNTKIQEFWGDAFPVLEEGEAIVESVFTVPEFRGHKIMPAVLTRIVKKAKDIDVRWLLIFVDIDNIPSLKGGNRSGFSPYTLRTEKWFLFKRSITFNEVPKSYMDAYFINVNASKS